MTIPRASMKTVISVAALLFFGAAAAVTQPSEPAVTRATVCVKSSGQMRLSTRGAEGCSPSERAMDMVVGGEVTDLRVGPGLVASREGGLVNLALDPSVLECEECSDDKVFAGFKDGPGEIPMGEPHDYAPQPIAQLDVPEGSYVISAKFQLVSPSEGAAFVRCTLSAEGDSDEAHVVLEESTPGPGAFWGGASLHVVKLQLVHRFQAAGPVVVSCADGFTFFNGPADPSAKFTHLKIIAMRVSSISNVLLSN